MPSRVKLHALGEMNEETHGGQTALKQAAHTACGGLHCANARADAQRPQARAWLSSLPASSSHWRPMAHEIAEAPVSR
jgi:hypothetical protein